MSLIFISICLWFLLLWLGQFGPRVNVPKCLRGGGGGGSPETTTTYAYQIYAPHQSISPDHPIYCYDAYGILVYTIEPHDSRMNYGTGMYNVPGSAQNTVVESISTATYRVRYSTDHIVIDYANACFYISEALISKPTSVTVWATFQYATQFTASNDTGKIIDGNWSTQMQTIFYAQPPAGYRYAILDLGTVKDIQAIDLIGGYFKPTYDTKFDCKYKATLQYSNDNINYYNISTDTNKFEMSSATGISFDEDKLGYAFSARYILVILEEVEKINYSKSSILVTGTSYRTEVVDGQMITVPVYGNYAQLVSAGIINEEEPNHAEVGDTIILREGLYAVSLTEASAYSDITIKAEAFLIPTTTAIDVNSSGDIDVISTDGFDDAGTAYIGLNVNNSFTYTSKTATSFVGVVVAPGATLVEGDYITQTIETDTTLYDYNGLLPKLGDRVYKKNQTKTEYLYTPAELKYLAKEYLKEFVKNHGKIQAEVMFAPYIKLFQTVNVTDAYNGINNARYFVESLSYKANTTSLTLARYPG